MFSKEKKLIQDFLIKFLEEQDKVFINQPWSADIFNRLKLFIIQGKMLRGSLVISSFSLFDKSDVRIILPIAAAIELIHAGFLIHDDIMDNDLYRRGSSSFFAQYQNLLEKSNREINLNFGKSMATCVGDITFFLGNVLLNNVNFSSLKKTEIINLCLQEFILVGFAQMQDIFNSISVYSITDDAIMNVYKHKTGRYTFSLPLMVGAIAANQNNTLISKFEKIGEDLGILFQIKDDEIGIFGKTEEIGKPIGSDIRENKKTLYWYYLFKNANGHDKDKLQKIFGNPHISEKDILLVQAYIKKYSVVEKIAEKTNTLKINIEKTIEDIFLPTERKKLFFDLLSYGLERNK